MTKDLAEQRCFILDGESGATINTLKRCFGRSRRAELWHLTPFLYGLLMCVAELGEILNWMFSCVIVGYCRTLFIGFIWDIKVHTNPFHHIPMKGAKDGQALKIRVLAFGASLARGPLTLCWLRMWMLLQPRLCRPGTKDLGKPANSRSVDMPGCFSDWFRGLIASTIRSPV